MNTATRKIKGIELHPAPVRNNDRLAAVMTNYRNLPKYALDEAGHIIGLNLENQGLDDARWQAFLDALPERGRHLQALKLSGNKLSSLEIGPEFSRLKYLDISQNKALKHLVLPASLKHLEKLVATECALEGPLHIPEGLEKLEQLHLRQNQIKEIRFDGDCPRLQILDLSSNALTRFRIPIGFSALRFLSLKNNKSLADLHIPAPLRSLTTLDLRNNALKQLPADLLSYSSLHTLHLHGNRWEGSISSYVAGGKENTNHRRQVMDFLGELSKGDIINERVKIIIVGNGRVGKTSLFKRLKGLPCDLMEKFTHGVQLGALEKEHLGDVTTEKLHAKVWDFGGQEVFYATHQFFLTDNSVYILAWTAEKNVEEYRKREKGTLAAGEKWRENGYWLENIRQYCPDIPILMIQTHIDKGKEPVNEVELLQDHQALCLDFSATSEAEPTAIRRKIAELINKHITTFGEKFPQTYDAVIGAVEKRKNDNKITKDTFVNTICKEAQVTPGAEESVLDYLVYTGTVIWYKNRPKLEDTIFVNPNWLTERVYKIISTALIEQNGRFDQNWIETKLPDMEPDERAQMLELLKEFELIFETEGEYIAPQFLPESLSKDTQNEFNKTKRRLSPAFRFRFPKFVPDNVMVNFVSRYGPYSDKVFWKNGISFTKEFSEPHAAGKAAKWLDAIVEFDPETKTLSVFTESGPDSRPLLSEICHAFVQLSRNANAEVALPGQSFVKWQDLKEAHENKDEKVIATDKSRIPMAEFDFIFNPDKKETEVEKATEKTPIFFSYAWGDNKEAGESREKIVDELYDELVKEGFDVQRDKKVIGYKGLISHFMKKIGRGKAIVVVISEKYLKSAYCMFELLEIFRKSNSDLQEFQEKIFPVVLEDAKIYAPKDLAQIIAYWRTESDELEELIKTMRPADIEVIYKDFKERNEIAQNIGVLVRLISDMNTLRPEILASENFEIIKKSVVEQLQKP
jgi:GTPase SAR1 family protein